MNYGTILLFVIFAVIGGIILGALYTLLNIMWNGRKAKKDFKKGKAFEVKENPTQEIKVPKPEEKKKKEKRSIFSKLFGNKEEKIREKFKKENSKFQKKWGNYIKEDKFTGTEKQYKQLQKDHQKLSKQFPKLEENKNG